MCCSEYIHSAITHEIVGGQQILCHQTKELIEMLHHPDKYDLISQPKNSQILAEGDSQFHCNTSSINCL